MQHQLPLEFKFNNEYTFDSFVAGFSDELVTALQNISSHQENAIHYFWGKAGVGKSHLLQALCQCQTFHNKPVAMIPLRSSDMYSPEMMQGLEAMALVCVDDVHLIAGKSEWEDALFHFYNRAKDAGTPVVISGDAPPAQLALSLNDLKSRLGWGLVFQLQDINDEQKILALQKRASIRGIQLNAEVGEFLMRRFSRETRTLMSLLDRLDKASLTEQRNLTIPFVKKVLDR